MKSFMVLAVLVAAAAAAPADDANAVILKQDQDNIGVDAYNYAFETSNGIAQQEQGQLQNVGTENEAIVVQGSFSYTGDDGQQYRVDYSAGPEGFVARGAHIPQ